MLKRLIIKSFAIIEDLTIDFKDGMTVLTGETGAGKSLIIDTISLLLGARADSDMIRYQDEKATIIGEFSFENPKIKQLCEKYEIKEDGNLVILREIFINKSNVIKINNSTVNLTILKQFASLLADIHVQNDTYRLFNPETYLSFIDPVDDEAFNKIFSDYSMALSRYQAAKKKYVTIENGQKASIDRLEFIQYEAKEIEALDLYEDKDIKLEEQINKLSNYDKIFNGLSESYNLLTSEYFINDNVYDASAKLRKLADYDSSYAEISDKLADSYDLIEECKQKIHSELNNMDYDDKELDNLVSELNEIDHVKTKYKKSVNELIERLQAIKLEIDMITNYDEVLEDAKNQVIETFSKLKNVSIKMTDYRKKLSKKIEKAIIEECKDLDLPNSLFEIRFNEVDYLDPFKSDIFTDNGVDSVDFMISLNKGEPLKPLNKTASGGELSRIMLAFKVFFSKQSHLSLMVFDEIDTGVSGKTASEIARKIHSISKFMQVFCITHMPQVAAIGDNHIYIYKETENNRTRTQIEFLTGEKRVEAIAVMLSGDKISRFAIEHARELIEELNE